MARWRAPGICIFLRSNQFIYVNPGKKIVIVKTSAYPDYNKDGDDKEMMSIAMFQQLAKAMAELN